VFAKFHLRRSPDSLSGLAPAVRPLSPNFFICHTSANSPVSPSIATLPKTTVSKPNVCHTSETPWGVFPFHVGLLATILSHRFRPCRTVSPNSHGIISFADPHPLSSFVSYRYKNLAGRGLATTRPESPMNGEPGVAARTVCATKLIEAHLSAAPLTCIFRAPNMALQSFTAHSQVTGEDDFRAEVGLLLRS